MPQKPNLSQIRKAVQEGVAEYARGGKSPLAIGKAFTEFYVKEIAYFTDNLTEEEEIKRGLDCDGQNDLGVDFVYEQPADDQQSESKPFWMIFQSKYKGKGNSLNRDEIAGFFTTHESLCNKTVFDTANGDVQLALRGFSERAAAVFVLLTNDEVSPKMRAEFERRKQAQMASPKWENFSWRLVSLSEIKDNYEQLQLSKKPPSSVNIPIEISDCDSGKGLIDLSSKLAKGAKGAHRTIVTAINGATLAKIWQEFRHSLFNRNIRGFLGKGVSKNKDITTTLEKTPELFYLYNNGISAICSSMVERRGGATMHCGEFQIINGAQTVCSIGQFADDNADTPKLLNNLKKVWVLARITQTDDNSEDGLNRDIINYNNIQNVIRHADFRSNDDIQVFLQKAFEKENFQCHGVTPCKRLIYKPKRMPSSDEEEREKKEKKNIIIAMEDAAKSLFAFMTNEPDKLNSQTKFLFDRSKDGAYWRVFGNNGKATSTLYMNDVKRIAAILSLHCFLGDQTSKLKRKKVEKDGKMTEEYPSDTMEGMVIRSGRHILWAFGFVVRKFYRDEADKIYDRILDGRAFQEGGFVQSWFDTIRLAMALALRQERLSGKELNFKMWLRDNDKLEAVEDMIDTLQSSKKIPIDKDGELFDAPKPTKRGKR